MGANACGQWRVRAVACAGGHVRERVRACVCVSVSVCLSDCVLVVEGRPSIGNHGTYLLG